MFKEVKSNLHLPEMEEEQLQFWKENDIFKKSSDGRRDRRPFVMYEGPPTANGKPGIHHVIGRVYKDLFPRYKTMRGYFVDRRGGWDTHGLPVEIEVEKKLGFTNKAQIEEYGIAAFNERCKESAFSRIQDWSKLTERIAYWVDLDRSYVTYKNEYIESVWFLLKQIWNKDLLYQGYKVVPYCPRCGTPLSDHEVSQGYADAVDPSICVRFPLVDEADTSLLVWTTTPWTLPANVAVAAHPNVEYVLVSDADGKSSEKFILAAELLDKTFGERKMTVLKTMTGKELAGWRYRPLFSFMPVESDAWYVVNADYVTTTDGTGLVHIAPAFGADDMAVARTNNLPVVMTIDDTGKFKAEVTPWAGQFVKDADPSIIDDLRKRGLMFSVSKITHSYPFCWRCDTPLLYYARPCWFIRTTAVRERMLVLNEQINWMPEHIQHGRFGNWLENNIDWALGRNRFWGTPLPVWQCSSCGKQHCIGSVAELSKLTGSDQSKLDLHRPYVDDIHFPCPDCGSQMQRVPELIDVWFDSGAMPSAQWHYPFENLDEFKQQYPADFICEAIDQTRGWFYSLLAISTLVFDENCFKNVICYGHILDGKGKKMSKHVGNVVDPWEVLNLHGADATRWYMYTASPPGNSRNFSADLVGEVVRNFILTLWNTYSFFVTYARLDGWTPSSENKPELSALDRWLISSTEALVRDVTRAYEEYDVVGATRPIELFVDQLSNWYLRRSRRRFWKSESDDDKQAAYETLYYVLVTLSKLLAPAMPFMGDEIYRNLVLSVDKSAPESVHLANWPQARVELIDEVLNHKMEVVMKLASLGHSARNKSSVKVRQPLSELAFALGSMEDAEVIADFEDVLADELNVKHVRLLSGDEDAVSFTLNPLQKQLGQKYRGLMPKLRAAILELPMQASARRFLQGLSVAVVVDGQDYEILPEEVEVITEAKSGYAVAADGAYLAALVTTLTPDLVHEGLVREFVRRVQTLRKDSGLEIADRIQIYYRASEELDCAIEQFAAFICDETLAVGLYKEDAPESSFILSDNFDGQDLRLGIRKVCGK